MAQIHIKIRVENSCDAQPRVLELQATVDTTMPYLCLPVAVTATLGLQSFGSRTVTLEDGTTAECRYVGPVTVQCGNCVCYTGAVEHGEVPMLGWIALGALGMMIGPDGQSLTGTPVLAPSIRVVA